MTVVLLDPYRPDLIPLRARSVLDGTVAVTEEVSTGLFWDLEHVVAATAPDDESLTLLSSDPSHPLVRQRIELGHEVIAAPIRSGEALLDAVALMDTLRRNGPWEGTQTHASLRRYLLEEVYELLDAIDTDDPVHLREELGDLLLQVLFHSRIAADRSDAPFDIDDVARSFTAKVAYRTPGVLSGAHADLETQIREWEERKAQEKARGSILDGIATTQPALSLTQKVLERLLAANYPIEGIDPRVLTVTVAVGPDSIEDIARTRVLELMDRVRAAEARALIDGATLDSPAAWLPYLALDPVESADAVDGAGADVEGAVDDAVDVEGMTAEYVGDPEDISDAEYVSDTEYVADTAEYGDAAEYADAADTEVVGEVIEVEVIDTQEPLADAEQLLEVSGERPPETVGDEHVVDDVAEPDDAAETAEFPAQEGVVRRQ